MAAVTTFENLYLDAVNKHNTAVSKLNILATLRQSDSARFDPCVEELNAANAAFTTTVGAIFGILGGNENPSARPESLIGRLNGVRRAMIDASNHMTYVTKFNYWKSDGTKHIEDSSELQSYIVQSLSAMKITAGLP